MKGLYVQSASKPPIKIAKKEINRIASYQLLNNICLLRLRIRDDCTDEAKHKSLTK